MHKSHKPDWDVRNYSYRCWFTDSNGALAAPPQVVWDTGKAKQQLWNGLVGLFCQVRNSERSELVRRRAGQSEVLAVGLRRELLAQVEKGDYVNSLLRGPERGEHYAPLLAKQGRVCYEYAREHFAAKLCSPDYEDVAGRFYRTLRNWLLKPQMFGPPTHKPVMDSLRLTFKEKNGGQAVQRIMQAGRYAEMHDTRALAPQNGDNSIPDYYENAYFTVGSAKRAQRVTLHAAYPGHKNSQLWLPADGLVKEVVLSGKQNAPWGWEWRLVWTISAPPKLVSRSGNACIGFDAGYRVFEDYVRCGLIYDGLHFYEVVLPRPLGARYKRHKGRGPLDLCEVWELESVMGTDVELVKAEIKAADRNDWPPPALAIMQRWTRVREAGLFRLRAHLSAAGIVLCILEEWVAKNASLFARVRHLEKRIVRVRTHLWRNLAIGLARNCAVIGGESDLSLKSLAERAGQESDGRIKEFELTGEWAERTSEQRINEAAQKWRAYVCHSDMRSFLKQACAKTDTALPPIKAAHTTDTCVCGAAIETGPALLLTCANGHRLDQDVTAALNLYRAVPDIYKVQATPLDLSLFPPQALRAIRPLSVVISALGDPQSQ